MDKIEIVRDYFASWLRQDWTRFAGIFANDIVYSECYGPEYHGLGQVERWFDDWNRRGRVLVWDIREIFEDGDDLITEWYFQCVFDGVTDGFDGVSLIRFNQAGKIISIREYQSKSEHIYPYGE